MKWRVREVVVQGSALSVLGNVLVPDRRVYVVECPGDPDAEVFEYRYRAAAAVQCNALNGRLGVQASST